MISYSFFNQKKSTSSFNKFLFSTISNYKQIIYYQHGDPRKVLKFEEGNEEIKKELKPNEILIKMKMAPINPADLNQIEGVYPLKPKLPAIGGNEGIGEVIEIGKDVKNQNLFKIGDYVIPTRPAIGTWRTHLKINYEKAVKISSKIDPVILSNMGLVRTAMKLITGFESLNKGDFLVQNAANSAVGQSVIQIAKFYGFKTINFIRYKNANLYNETKNYLESIGADFVSNDIELKDIKNFRKKFNQEWGFKNQKKPKLFLNCVGDFWVDLIAKILGNDSSIVTYGGMARGSKVSISPSKLIFQNFKLFGFWLSQWLNTHSNDQIISLNSLCQDMLHQVDFKIKTQVVSFNDFYLALDKNFKNEPNRGKIVLKMD
ncbi:enoyl-[acyl-carrier-protein] reductase [Anaeramoeba ignava]|uniref:Enoyl-[acyl-carrier-protein] reductase n=1 Tax=Anaeramoeba ignava TaxID=1746090 RepID=A0A9Q0LHI0_ANAIG|nr:enoyl-[acyl-carrier-protein] reductase [Anaeramoeba ignava]|eukprot:Anaeramoba_ignava/a611654_21.p1 GENE.a611654_21~~a611654_21.p1  ORF type:complete len:374 (-),score=125.63 a611654_21:15-1136(-)